MIGDTLTTIEPREHSAVATVKPDTAQRKAAPTMVEAASAEQLEQNEQHTYTPTDAATYSFAAQARHIDSLAMAAQQQQAAADTTAGVHFTMPFLSAPDSTSTHLLGLADPKAQGGDPTIYSLRHDTTVGVVLVLCFMLIIYAINRTQSQIGKIARSFLDSTKRRTLNIASLPEMHYLLQLMLCSAIEVALIYYNLTAATTLDTAFRPPLIMVIYVAIAIVYLGLKTLFYAFINWVFFDSEQRAAWNGVYVLATAASSLLLFPILIAQIYLGLSAVGTMIAVVALLGTMKLLEMSKAASILFAGEIAPIHTTIYLSVMEIVPFGVLIAVLDICREAIILMI